MILHDKCPPVISMFETFHLPPRLNWRAKLLVGSNIVTARGHGRPIHALQALNVHRRAATSRGGLLRRRRFQSASGHARSGSTSPTGLRRLLDMP